MKLQAGQVFWYEVVYPKTGETITRPVAIIEITEEEVIFVTFVALTHSGIKDIDGKYDKWKVPLFKGKDNAKRTTTSKVKQPQSKGILICSHHSRQ